MLTTEEIDNRKLLWIALSDLWLDTELTDMTYQSIVRDMISSAYSIEKIEKIFAEEVAPVVYSNLFNIFPGGTWSGFDSQWLSREIIKNLEKQKRNLIYRTWVKSVAGKFIMTKMVQNDWEKVVKLYKSKLAEKEKLKD